MRTKIDQIMQNETCQVLMVTSAGKSEGKTTAAVNLACSYAQNNKKVLLIDANLRTPFLHEVFGTSNSNGLTNVVTDRYEISDIIRYTMMTNLFLISSGPSFIDPIELLTSNKMSGLLEELKKEFDLIIMDTPPAMRWSDAQIIASMSDGVLLVMKDGTVKKNQALKLKSMIEQVNTRVVGVVFNNKNKRKVAN
ncbi:CpsD/CapB family tyrosine-protein kinase [Paenibacillus glycanilyticus]|uniref:CpsD/CapB family tyrosine-protein kinase n=1 Tax=Paenibacillus glycanilyticus TaxID=126569 RepID=UPI00203F6F0F|nr:CpsD/CapB family tyrosine-protein kinase [Paenibacillus glycanilyticus]MCM3630986.1 CpsD/CapB family tyrosine-protein kinase [Paenibacillus glycanilyticus]